jgi:hypothetical protein
VPVQLEILLRHALEARRMVRHEDVPGTVEVS